MKRPTLLAASALFALSMYAQSPSIAAFDRASVTKVEHKDTTEYFITLHANAPKLQNIHNVPRFAILGKEGDFYLGLGTNISAVAVYDFGAPISDPNAFVTSAIPMNLPPGNGAQVRFSGQQSTIYLNVVGLPGSKDQIGAYVSFNFYGDKYTPHLKHAYLKYRNITAGYTYSIFTDIGACPATIDYEGPNAFTAMTHGTIAYEPFIDKHKKWRVGVGLDMPENSYTDAAHTATVTQRVPDIPFYIQHSYCDNDAWIRLSGIVRNMYYRNEIAQKNVDEVGWGVKVSGTTPLFGDLSAYYQGVYGKGIASYIQDLSGGGLDLMPQGDNAANIKPVEVWGALGALQYNFSPRCFATAIYSHVRTYAKPYTTTAATPWGDNFKYAQYVCANVFYDINSIVQVGAEYLYGRRVDYSGLSRHDNRLQGLLRVSF